MISYVSYTFIFIMIGITSLNYQYKDRLKIKLAFLLFSMSMMASFRGYDVGNDTRSYYNFFKQMVYSNTDFDPRIEIGYRYFNIFIAFFSENFTWVLFFSSLFLFVVLYKFYVKYSNNYIMCGIFFWLIGFITIISATRQAVAIGFVYLAIIFLVERKRILFFSFVIIAASFHLSAMIFLVMLPLSNIKLTMRKVTILISVVTAITLFSSIFRNIIIIFLGPYYANYIGTSSGILAVLFNSLMGLLYIIIDEFQNKNTSDDVRKSHIYNISKWSTLIYSALALASYNISIIGRLSYYFIPGLVLYISYVTKRKKILNFISIVFLFAYNIMVLWLRPEWNSFFPFSFIQF